MRLSCQQIASVGLIGVTALAVGLACGSDDAILQRAEELRAQGGPSATETPGPAAAGRPNQPRAAASEAAAGSPGVHQEQPPPGTPEEPSPGEPSDPLPVDGSPSLPPPGEVAEAQISGTVQVPDGMTGTVHIVAFASDPKAARNGGGHPNVAGFLVLDAPGEFTLGLSNGGQPVWLDAHLDLGAEPDGRPGPGEPMGFWGAGISTQSDTEGIVLELSVRPHEGLIAGEPLPPPGE
jgi:hypothetical protein